MAGSRWRSGCTVVAPGKHDGGKTIIMPIPVRPDALPPPKPLEASVLIVANLERSSANLADRYAAIITGLGDLPGVASGSSSRTWASSRPTAITTARACCSADAQGPRPAPTLQALLAQRSSRHNIQDYDDLLPRIGGALGNISDEDLPIALRLLASSGNFDGDGETSEAKNLIEFGRGLGGEALSPALGGIQRSALFDKPRDLFIIVYLQSLPRRCALDSAACLVDGRKPTDIFPETDAIGAAAWLNFAGPGINAGADAARRHRDRPKGRAVDAFRARCGEVPGFPPTLFDVMAPSPNAYFSPLTDSAQRRQPRHGQRWATSAS